MEWDPSEPVSLPYGYSTITAVDLDGDELRVIGSGSCSVTGGIITAASTTDVCQLKVQDIDAGPVAGVRDISLMTFTPAVSIGSQSATLAAESAPTTLKKGATITLGTKSQTVTHANYRSKGKPITWKVTKGKDVCSLTTSKKGKVTLTASKKGSCTVQATAPKVKNRYKAYKTTHTWKIK